MKRGQFSLEFIIVLGALLTVLATISIPLYANSRNTAGKLTKTMKAREAANELALSLNSVYTGSVDTSNPATYWLPRNVIEIGELPIDNELNVKIILEHNGKNIEITVPTLLPGSWENRVFLENISLTPDNRTRHRTKMTLLENKEKYEKYEEPEHWVKVFDKILESE